MPLKTLREKLKDNYESLALLEAIDAFDQIRSLVVETSEEYPCQAKEALLGLYQLIRTIIQEGHLERTDKEQLWRHLTILEEDLYRVATRAEAILDTVYKVQGLLSDVEDIPEQ